MKGDKKNGLCNCLTLSSDLTPVTHAAVVPTGEGTFTNIMFVISYNRMWDGAYRLDGRKIGVRIQVGVRFSPLHYVGALPSSYPMGTGGKVAGA